MTDDFEPDETAAIVGQAGSYVPCLEEPADDDEADDDDAAIVGQAVGYVAVGESAASDDDPDDDDAAVIGQAVGYVPGPCELWQLIDSWDVRTECDESDFNLADSDRIESRPWTGGGGG